jgi:uncharacterized Ntn-hydrolase superfamily protein
MTFSLLVRDPETGAFGSVISSSSPAVAARCVHLRDGVGGVHSQNITDPRLGPLVLDRLEHGLTASEALSEVLDAHLHSEFRQVTVIDASGRTAVHSGKNALGIVSAQHGPSAVAAGNMLAGEGVITALLGGFAAAAGQLEERLLAGFRAALDAGGEAGPVHSAGLSVVADAGWRVTDLRVDWSDAPLARLEELLDVWLPQRDAYIQRGHDPQNSPGYGVAGDDRG